MTFREKTAAVFGLAIVILITIAFLSHRSVLKSDLDRAWVAHTHQVLEQTDEVMTDLLNAETGERGYMLTGEPSFLAPYENAVGKIDGDVKRLRGLTSDNPTQQRALDRMEPLIAARMGMLRDRIDARRRLGLLSGAEIVRLGPGKEYMDQIRTQLGEMKARENDLLASRTATADRSSRVMRGLIVGGDALAIVFFSLSGMAVGQEMRRRRLVEQEVQDLNTNLERRIADRTAELAEQARELERSNNELQQFAYVASHDLQEPLRMVASFTQLLAKRYSDKLDADARDFISYAVDGARRMQTLISDLLTYSRVGTQGKPLVPTDSEAVLNHVLIGLGLAIEENHAVITHDPLPAVQADALQLGQLFQNLLSNAIKFHGEDPPRVHISASRDAERCKFSVRDNGIGIAAEQADRIFIIFQRLHTKAEYPGTGIGLAVCKKIVERHGGRIWPEPAPGGGTIFSFTLAGAAIDAEERETNEHRLPAYTH